MLYQEGDTNFFLRLLDDCSPRDVRIIISFLGETGAFPYGKEKTVYFKAREARLSFPPGSLVGRSKKVAGSLG